MAVEQCQALLLEDEPNIARLLSTILARERFAVQTVGNASEAIGRLSTDRYHLFILDLKDRDHGEDVIQFVKTHRLELLTTIIAISAHPAAIRAALRGEYPEPICRFVAKPFDLGELTRAIHSCKALCDSAAVPQASPM